MIRTLLKWFVRLCLLLLAGGVVLILCKDAILRKLAERRIQSQTGLRTRIGDLHLGFSDPVVTLKGFTLYNRPEFGGAVLVHIPELHVEYDPEELRSARLRLTLLRLNVSELNIVRNAAGQTNVFSLLKEVEEKGIDSLRRSEPEKQLGFAGIDRLNFSLGTIRYLDLADPTQNREARFGLRNLEIGNIRSEADLYGVAAIVLMRSGVVGLDLASGADQKPESPVQAGWNLVKHWVGLAQNTTNTTTANPVHDLATPSP